MSKWISIRNGNIRVGGSVGKVVRGGISIGKSGPRVNASVGGGHDRGGVSIPVGGSKRRKPVWYGWFG